MLFLNRRVSLSFLLSKTIPSHTNNKNDKVIEIFLSRVRRKELSQEKQLIRWGSLKDSLVSHPFLLPQMWNVSKLILPWLIYLFRQINHLYDPTPLIILYGSRLPNCIMCHHGKSSEFWICGLALSILPCTSLSLFSLIITIVVAAAHPCFLWAWNTANHLVLKIWGWSRCCWWWWWQ